MAADLAARTAELLTNLVPGRSEIFDELRAHYAHDLVFRDPIQEVHGIDAFLAMNERLLGRMKSLDWRIHAAFGDGHIALIEWTMIGKPRFGPEVTVDGATRVQARDGRVVDHRDYWDLSELAASIVPFGERVRHALLKPLA